MSGKSPSSLTFSNGQSVALPLGGAVESLLQNSKASDIARMITEAAFKAQQDKADRLLARKIKRRLADIDSGKTVPRAWAEVRAELAL